MKLTATLLALMLVTACAPTGGAIDCAGWRPIVLAGQSIDGLKDQDASAILAHNEYGRARGCW
jgi:hypothetical protein